MRFRHLDPTDAFESDSSGEGTDHTTGQNNDKSPDREGELEESVQGDIYSSSEGESQGPDGQSTSDGRTFAIPHDTLYKEDSGEPPDHTDDWDYKYSKHLTISRDHTAASSWHYQLLTALRSDTGAAQLEQPPGKVSLFRIPDDYNPFEPLPGYFPNPPLSPKPTRHSRELLLGIAPALLQRSEMSPIILNQEQEVPNYFTMEPPAAAGSRAQNLNPTGGFYAEASSNTEHMMRLENEMRKLYDQQLALGSTTWLVLHMVDGEPTTCLVEPSWMSTQSLKGNSPLADENEYLRHRPDVAFIVYKYYKADHQAKATQKAKKEGRALPEPCPYREAIRLHSRKMMAAFDMFVETHPAFKDEFPEWVPKAVIPSPFLFWYAYRSKACLDQIPEPDRSQMKMLAEWIEHNYSQTYKEAEAQFSRGFVSATSMPFFCRPGEVLVSRTDKGIRGYIADSWADEQPREGSFKERPRERSPKRCWQIKAYSYGYDGHFYRDDTNLRVELDFDDDHPEVDTKDLEVLPLRLASDEFRLKLERRGQMMWACRHRSIVSYDDKGGETLDGVSLTYLSLRPSSWTYEVDTV